MTFRSSVVGTEEEAINSFYGCIATALDRRVLFVLVSDKVGQQYWLRLSDSSNCKGDLFLPCLQPVFLASDMLL